MLLTHGARSVLWHAKAAAVPTALQRWARHAEQRRGHNVAAIAVANTLARIVWAVWTRQRAFSVERLASRSRSTVVSPEDCTARTLRGAPVGPAWGYADNSAGRERPCKRLAPHARMSMMARR